MAKTTQDHMPPCQPVPRDSTGFLEMVNAQTEEGKYGILSELLSEEFDKTATLPAEALKHAKKNPESVVVNFGNPLMGLLVGAAIIAVTTGGFFLWDNTQGTAAAEPIVSIDRN